MKVTGILYVCLYMKGPQIESTHKNMRNKKFNHSRVSFDAIIVLGRMGAGRKSH